MTYGSFGVQASQRIGRPNDNHGPIVHNQSVTVVARSEISGCNKFNAKVFWLFGPGQEKVRRA